MVAINSLPAHCTPVPRMQHHALLQLHTTNHPGHEIQADSLGTFSLLLLQQRVTDLSLTTLQKAANLISFPQN